LYRAFVKLDREPLLCLAAEDSHTGLTIVQTTQNLLRLINKKFWLQHEWRMNPLSLSKIAHWLNCMTTLILMPL